MSLLDELDELRSKFSTQTNDDKRRMKAIIEVLIDTGVYTFTPQAEKMGIASMVECYGSRWHEYAGILECPHCHCDLRDLENGPPYKREIGIYLWDRSAFYKCPDCDSNFGRFPDGHPYFLSQSKMDFLANSQTHQVIDAKD